MPLDKEDTNGQPCNRFFNAQRIADRATDELIGMCKGVLADGIVNEDEANVLMRWLRANEEAKAQWPGNIIHSRICEYLEDGVLDRDERDELFDFLASFTGKPGQPLEANLSTALPFDSPMPDLFFDGEAYCLTGRFAYGSRKECQLEIQALGGSIHKNPLKSGCIVVVGTLGSRDWMHSTHGRKIEQAIKYRESGCPVGIISEDHWIDCLSKTLNL